MIIALLISIKIAWLLCLLGLNRIIGYPFLCAAIYTAGFAIIHLLAASRARQDLLPHLILTLVLVIWSSIVFRVLHRLKPGIRYYICSLFGAASLMVF